MHSFISAGMDPAKQRTVYSAAGQPTPAPVCGKAGENSSIYDQRESSHYG